MFKKSEKTQDDRQRVKPLWNFFNVQGRVFLPKFSSIYPQILAAYFQVKNLYLHVRLFFKADEKRRSRTRKRRRGPSKEIPTNATAELFVFAFPLYKVGF